MFNFVSGSSQDVNFGDVTFLDGLSRISGWGWINVDNITQDHIIFSKSVSSGNTLQFFVDDVGSTSGRTNTITVFIRLSANSAKVECASNIVSAGSLLGVGFSWEAGSSTGLKVYPNGTEDANSPASTASQGNFTNHSGSLLIGQQNGGSYADGQIGGCSLWGDILIPNEFQQLANYKDPEEIRPEKLLWSPSMEKDSYDPTTGKYGVISGATVSPHYPVIRKISSSVPYITAVVGVTGKSNPLSGPLGGPLAGVM